MSYLDLSISWAVPPNGEGVIRVSQLYHFVVQARVVLGVVDHRVYRDYSGVIEADPEAIRRHGHSLRRSKILVPFI